ncbi:hypothetical protein [Nocardioides cynanchi]|uniref:hypothetical protein n=1 Tax=Nocardioides cynanchi TaxID=2558918 RepID=UPI001243BF46|nr:hypothetical protein [Nocardioides cynanchi]
MTRLRAVGATALLLAALTSCGNRGGVTEKDGHFLLVAPKEISEAGVGFTASRLVMVGDCVGLDLGDDKVAIVIWPNGTEWVSTKPLAIDVPGLGDVKQGDYLAGGGADYEGPQPLPGIEVPTCCRNAPLVSFSPDR